MKILILNAGDDYSLGWSYKRGFDALGHDTTLVDPATLLDRNFLWRNRYSRRLLEKLLIERFNRQWIDTLASIDADMVWIGKGAWAVPWLWTEYKARRPQTKLVCYNADDPVTTYSRGGNRPWVTESISCFDLFCTYKESLEQPLRDRGARNVAIIPFAWDPQVHPTITNETLAFDLVFVGNGDSYRETWLGHILEQSWTKTLKIAIFGSWMNVTNSAVAERLRPERLVGETMSRAIASSKVSINILRLQNEGSHNMRTFETPGSGGVNASLYSDQQEDFFPGGESSYYFTSKDDVGAVLEEAVRNDRSREAIRTSALQRVKRHSYRDRATQLLDRL